MHLPCFQQAPWRRHSRTIQSHHQAIATLEKSTGRVKWVMTTVEFTRQNSYYLDMDQKVELTWEDIHLPFNEWCSLDQLWLYIAQKSQEFAVSYCYAEARNRRWLQFTDLKETRYPGAGTLKATAGLATRPVVAKPTQPLHLPRGGQITLFVGTTLWFCLTRDDELLLDAPLERLSDSWFGPDTQVGEVCYASPTHARLTMEGVPRNPFKAVTPVEIKNHSDAPLVIDKVNLPVPNLALYLDGHRHWTSQVTITLTSEQQRGEVHISPGAPPQARFPVDIAPPRRKLEGGMLHKAMSLLLG